MNKALNLYDLPYQGNPFCQAIHFFLLFLCTKEKNGPILIL